VIAAAGDIACGSATPPTAPCRHSQTSDILVGRRFDAVLTLGDSQYENGIAGGLPELVRPHMGESEGHHPPGPGNHEYLTSGGAGYFGYFGEAAGDPTKGYYSFDLGSWHIIALNSNCPSVSGCDEGSPQERWLRADLAAHQNACTLAYWHHPRFTSGSVHQGDPRTGAFWQALYESHADVVLTGHQHNYERFAPQSPAGIADPSNGIRQFVVGTGGKDLYSFDSTPAPNSVVRHSSTFGVLKLILRPTSYEWQFIPEAGETFSDAGTGMCVGLRARKTVALKATPRRVLPGRKTHLSAAVSPCEGHEQEPVRFQRRRGGAWKTVSTVPSDQACAARVDRRVSRTTRFRAVAPADEDHATGTSNVVKVRVRSHRRASSPDLASIGRS
jgi:calcineurin-like phosphoesterase family protein